MKPETALIFANLAFAVQCTQFSATVDLKGKYEVPPNDASSTGYANIHFDDKTNKLDWDIGHNMGDRLDKAHFHGPASTSENGDLQVNMHHFSLFANDLESPIRGKVVLDNEQAKDLMNGLWYINLHTDEYPKGELRGQIELSMLLSTTCADQDFEKCDFCLSQNNFELGTFRISQPGKYCVEENIVFNPMAGTTANPNDYGEASWFPENDLFYPGCVSNSGGAYALGFFAVISIESSNVILDLNGHTVSYHQHFYLQQRFGSIIEISNSPFLPKAGPANFGSVFENVHDITIKNGDLGLTSHHGIHGNNASNLIIENLNIYDFEVGAVQLNGFNNVHLNQLKIGPSLQNVPVTAYYSNARFLVLALRQILNHVDENNLGMPSVAFSYLPHGQSLYLSQIYDNLVLSMDIFYRSSIGKETAADKTNRLYAAASNLFTNRALLPDGSALYGIILNSHNVAVNNFGDSPNIAGENVLIEDVSINDLKLKVNAVPALYFDECDGEKTTKTILKGPFGELMDVRLMIAPHLTHLIDEYETENVDLSQLKYIGNPLADAQIAVFLFKHLIPNSFSSSISPYFLKWALNDGADWPTCASFICNGDIMFHQNKGIVGLRMDGIENAEIKNVHISNLVNESPLAAHTCSNYSGAHDGGHTATKNKKEREGAMSSDVRGISLCDGDLRTSGLNSVEHLNSCYGDAVGVDLMDGACLILNDEFNGMKLIDFQAASKVTKEEYAQLKEENRTPFPNNFNLCHFAIDDSSKVMNGKHTQTEGDCALPPALITSAYNYARDYAIDHGLGFVESGNPIMVWTIVIMLSVFCFFGNTR